MLLRSFIYLFIYFFNDACDSWDYLSQSFGLMMIDFLGMSEKKTCPAKLGVGCCSAKVLICGARIIEETPI